MKPIRLYPAKVAAKWPEGSSVVVDDPRGFSILLNLKYGAWLKSRGNCKFGFIRGPVKKSRSESK